MASSGFTSIYNDILRDPTVSLSAKGLYTLVKSFTGLENFDLTKRRIKYACSDSTYKINEAWKELKKSGYLQHFYSPNENGSFCHYYNLMQHAGEPMEYIYSPDNARPNGDCVCVVESQSDYTNVSTDILRDRNISLACKALFALVSYLTKIPGFVLRPEGVRSLCVEKQKHFQTLWKNFKLSGLLKQHRYPTGGDNDSGWSYDYDLCETPDLETPYLINYHANGEVSSISLIKDVLNKLKRVTKKCLPKLQRKLDQGKDKLPFIRRKHRKKIEAQINVGELRKQYGAELTDTLVAAIFNISRADQLTVQGVPIPIESRSEVLHSISQETLTRFLESTKIDFHKIKSPVKYLQSAIYTYHQKLLLEKQSSGSADPAPAANADSVDYLSPEYPNSRFTEFWEERFRAHREEVRKHMEQDEDWQQYLKQISTDD